jgi:hypothetical protein
MAPYPFTITKNRVTDEKATMTFLNPSHKLFNFPNKIKEEDLNGWIQERSIYHASELDSNYKTFISMHDPGEADAEGSLIMADYGKGKFIYTGISFFRQLPTGVIGAYKLFANLLSVNQLMNSSRIIK